MKFQRIIYWIATAILSLILLGSAGMYIFNHAEVAKIVASLGFPTFIIYPLAAAKILGVTAIITKKSKTLKEWAYAGFFYDFVLAIAGHINAGDGGYPTAVAALILLGISYSLDRRIYN